MKKTTIALTLLFFALFFIFHAENSYANEAIEQNPDALIALLESELSKPSSNDGYEHVADELLELIKHDKFEEVETRMSKFIEEKKLTQNGIEYFPALVGRMTLVGKSEKELFTHLNKWIEEYPDSAIAYTVRGSYYKNYAWKMRGNSFSSGVSNDAWKLFKENIKLSYLDLEKARELDKSVPYALQLMMTLDSSSQGFNEIFFQIILENYKEYPNFFAYKAKLISLMPKWGGSWEQMFSFAYETAKSAPPKTLLPLILATAHKEAGDRSENKAKYYNSGNVWKEIEASYNKVLNDFPKSAQLKAEFADVAIDAGKLDIAYKQMEDAIKIDPYKRVIYKTLEDLFDGENDLDKQQIILEKFIELYPEDHWGFRSLGRSLKRQGKYKEAIVAFEKAIELNPNDLWSLRKKCTCYTEIATKENKPGYHEKALKDCAKVTEMTPKNAAGFQSLGGTLNRQGKYYEAINAFSKAIELDPYDAWSFEQRCWTYNTIAYNENKPEYYEKAIEDCRKSIKIDPKNADVFQSLGGALKEQRKFKQAVAAFSKALELNPNDSWSLQKRCASYSEMGYQYKKMDYYRKALRDCSKAIEIDPNNSDAFTSLGYLLNVKGNHKEAANILSKAIELNPNDSSAYLSRARTYERLGKRSKAAEDYKMYEKLKKTGK